uniref:Enamelin n=1 Tax=Varanus komodoensis TaxID=61221 RepID=A0A8D2IUB9_VARKO
MPFGRPPVSNEEGTPYFGYGYHGMGGRPPYYSEEMFEQDFEKPKEKEAPKTTEPATNSTISDTNSTISNQASQGGNATISGLSSISNAANSSGLQSKLISGNEVLTLSPTVLMPGGNAAAQNGMDQPSYRPKSPNVNGIQSFPSGSQPSTGQGSQIYQPLPDMGDTRPNAFISQRNPSVQTENPTYSLGYGENSNHRGNLQNTNPNHLSENIRVIPYGQQEQPRYSERNPLGQRERGTFPSSNPLGRWNKESIYRDNSLNRSPPEGHSLDPQFNKLEQVENVYNVRENVDSFQPSKMHQSNTLSHQGVLSATRRTPLETGTHQYAQKEQSFNHPYHEREQFPLSQNHLWKNREDSWAFQEAPPKYNSMYSSGSSDHRGHASYVENNSYGQRTHSTFPRAWEDGTDPPTIGPPVQRESLPYSPAFTQQEHEPYSEQNLWNRENHMFDLDGQYRNRPPYNPPQPPTYPKYSVENPFYDRGNLPYKENNQWTPEEQSPVQGAEQLRHTENSPYHINNVLGHSERNLQNQRSSSAVQSTSLLQGRPQYAERKPVVPQMVRPSSQKDVPPYFNTYSSDIRRNPAFMEDTRRRFYPDTLRYADDYPTEQRTVSHPPANHLCCASNSPGTRENVLAPLRSAAPSFRLASWEHKGSPAYPEGGHPQNAGQASYLTGKMLPNQREHLGEFREEAAGLQKSPPCCNPQLRQENPQLTSYEPWLPQPRNAPCCGSSIRGDGHNVLGRSVGANPSKREPEKGASTFLPETFAQPQGIRGEALVSDTDRKGHREAQGPERIPCFASWLKQYLSSTGAPLDDQQHVLVYEEDPGPTGRPDILLLEPQPISSTNPSHDIEDNWLKFSSPGEELVQQPTESTPDCSLLQNK